MPNPALRKYLNIPSGDSVIWRYISLDKYLSLITTSQLYLSRADRLEDPYEARIPNIERFDGFPSVTRSDEEVLKWRDHLESLPRSYFVSCWHSNSAESAAMWDLYSNRNSGIAIKTTVKNLSDALGQQDHDIGRVSYSDFNEYELDFLHAKILVAFKKRLSFVHENEVRVILERRCHQPMPSVAEDSLDVSRSLNIDLKTLCHEIKFSPMMPDWLCKSITQISSLYGLESERFTKSDLYDRKLR